MFKRTNAKGLEWPLEWRDEELLQALADVGFDTVRACITACDPLRRFGFSAACGLMGENVTDSAVCV